MNLDVNSIVQNFIVFISGSATLWVFSKTWKNARDLNALFKKIRNLEDKTKNL